MLNIKHIKKFYNLIQKFNKDDEEKKKFEYVLIKNKIAYIGSSMTAIRFLTNKENGKYIINGKNLIKINDLDNISNNIIFSLEKIFKSAEEGEIINSVTLWTYIMHIFDKIKKGKEIDRFLNVFDSKNVNLFEYIENKMIINYMKVNSIILLCSLMDENSNLATFVITQTRFKKD